MMTKVVFINKWVIEVSINRVNIRKGISYSHFHLQIKPLQSAFWCVIIRDRPLHNIEHKMTSNNLNILICPPPLYTYMSISSNFQ